MPAGSVDRESRWFRMGIAGRAILLSAAMLVPIAGAAGYVRQNALHQSAFELALEPVRHPELTPGHLLSCLAFLAAGRADLALAACDRAVQSDPSETLALKMRGGILLGMGEFERAKIDFTLAIEQDPRDAEAYDFRAQAFLATGQFADAFEDLDRALAIEPNNTSALDDIGYGHQLERKYDAAIRDFTVSLSVDASNAAAWNGRCWVRFLANKELGLALADCRQAARLDARRADVQDSLGWVYLRLDRPRDAIRTFDQAISGAPGLASSLYGRGIARLRIGERRAGRADIAAARALEPGIVERFQTYGIALPRSGVPEQPGTPPVTGPQAS